MATKTVKCAKLNEDLPGIDADSEDGERALRMALLIGGQELQQRVRDQVSMRAWEMWTDHMLMVMNEYRLDPTSDEANDVLKPQMEAFFFGNAGNVPGTHRPGRRRNPQTPLCFPAGGFSILTSIQPRPVGTGRPASVLARKATDDHRIRHSTAIRVNP